MDKCPYIISKGYDDEIVDLCSLSEKPSGRIRQCVLTGDDKCDIFEDVKREDAYEEYLRAGVTPGNLARQALNKAHDLAQEALREADDETDKQ